MVSNGISTFVRRLEPLPSKKFTLFAQCAENVKVGNCKASMASNVGKIMVLLSLPVLPRPIFLCAPGPVSFIHTAKALAKAGGVRSMEKVQERIFKWISHGRGKV